MKQLSKKVIALGAGIAMAGSSAMAAFTFTDGDLILGFQATSGTGSDKNVFYNLGSGTAFRDNAGQGALGNIGGTLSSVYGSNWYERSDLFFGVVGNLNQNPTSGIGSRSPVDGDPSRTFYLSSATVAPGATLLIPGGTYSSSALGTAGNSVSSMEGIFPTLTELASGAAVLDQTAQPVEWANSWSNYNPTPGAAFNTFTGGIQQSLGKAGDMTYVDIQRVLATNTGADPMGIVGGGTYMGTIGISNTGAILAIPEPSASLLLVAAGAALSLRRRRQTA